MLTLNQLNQSLEETESLRLVTQVYSELASNRLQQVRANIERNRKIFDELFQLYYVVNMKAAGQGIFTAKGKSAAVSLLLTSNHLFYGSLETPLIKAFMLNTAKGETERVVLGKTGLEYLKGVDYREPFRGLVLEEDFPNNEELLGLAIDLARYRKVLVYYSRFKNVLTQRWHILDISSFVPESPVSMGSISRFFEYIFEPEIGEMLKFFEVQIGKILLSQAFLEAELSRTASRLVSMDEAQSRALELLNFESDARAQMIRSLDNMKLLEMITGLKSLKGNENDF